MMKVFLDTNILLDFGFDREEADFAEGILQLGKNGLIEIYASYLSYANMGYILRHHPTPERYELVRKKDFQKFCRLPFLTSEEFLLQFDYEE